MLIKQMMEEKSSHISNIQFDVMKNAPNNEEDEESNMNSIKMYDV